MFEAMNKLNEVCIEVLIKQTLEQRSGSHKLLKSWKSLKITQKSSMHGKIMDFEKPE